MHQEIEILCKERDKMRDESIVLGERLHKTILIFFSIGIATIGIAIEKDLMEGNNTRELIVIVLSQLQFVLALLWMTIQANQRVHAGYLQAIEHKINKHLETDIIVWESHVAKKYLRKPSGSYFIGSLIFSVAMVAMFVYSIYLSPLCMSNIYKIALLSG